MTPDVIKIGPDEIAARLNYASIFPAVKAAMKSHSNGSSVSAAQVLFPSEYSDVHVKSAVLNDAPIFTVKLAGWSQVLQDKNGSGHSGLILVCDSLTCQPIALLQDDHLISDYRTGAVGALAAASCTSPEIETIGLLGAGIQARQQIMALSKLKTLKDVKVWARRSDAANDLVRDLEAALPDVTFLHASSPQEAVHNSTLVISATAAKDPLINSSDVQPGQTVLSVGADDETKCELSPELVEKADVVYTDSISQAREFGNIARALSSGKAENDINLCELGSAWSKSDALRETSNQTILISLTGMGVQDLATVSTLFDWGK